MKKSIVFGAFLLLFSSVFAQAPHVKFGVKGGLNVATLTNANMDSRTGFHAGAFSHIHVTNHFALQPEVLYSQQGAKLPGGATQRINYVNVPVVGQYMFGNGARLQTGPQVGFLTNSKTTSGNNDNSNTNAYKSADFSWTFGAGYLLPGVGLGIDARYNLGLTDIAKSNSDIKNSVWQVGLFYQF